MFKIMVFSIVTCLGCGLKDVRLVRKKIDNGDIVIQWFYYSYITSNSPDIITVSKGNEEKEIYRGHHVISGIMFNDSSIILRLVEPSRNYMIHSQAIDSLVYGYKIIVDSTATYADLRKIPDGVKE